MPRSDKSSDSLRSIEAQLAHVQQEHMRLAQVIREAKARQRAISSEMRTLEAHLRLARDPRKGDVATLQAGTLGEAAAAALSRAGKPVRIIDLVKELQDAGKLLRTEWAYSTLAKTLARDPRFRREPGHRGYWKLAVNS
jgi:hypothetical protein